MPADLYPFHRYAVILALAQESSKPLGRTALMKLLYFLQQIKGVPLGYDFSLYSYGPFDSNVLGDLGMTEQLGAVEEQTVIFPGGYGYEIRRGKAPAYVREKGWRFVEEHSTAIKSVLGEYGHYGGGQLELLSTMVFVDQEAGKQGRQLSVEHLIRQTLTIKPKFTEPHARKLAAELIGKDALRATQSD